ncbi:MAG: hypothetical protein GAK29_04455 [Acinetobacter bereziniae]|uniref:Uncharacterized protein n=1 Tax=Acinetobacter bereziniae TaxID=106648 RepID=A0A833P987_ACIBZ|nr:MAG: hypothetical protein GAK29_04455 [Acinetobacter bereziniae]
MKIFLETNLYTTDNVIDLLFHIQSSIYIRRLITYFVVLLIHIN